ncbi:Uncharacterized protein HA466_0049370 [Hirschfeldia incana]|nr:Uncharacterized protein HA466_0049370 [Hirschfeldia incana]
MDFKGIAWVENVYQKFEAMCLEVEDLIVQDTAKYVESQVQTVGNSVKKFCSDVVQDWLPDDSVVSEKPLPVYCRKETNEDRMQTSSSSVSEQKSEILEQLSGRSFEESCIILDRDELHCVFPDRKENDKHKSFKQIRDAISSRMKQNREKEYKQLARQWYAEDVENGRECGDKQNKENQYTEESEWELL